MNAEAIRRLLKATPFIPFEVVLTNGSVHRVVHPEAAILSPSRLIIVDMQTDELSIVSLLHIAEIKIPQSVG